MKRQSSLFASHMQAVRRIVDEGKAMGIVGIYGSGKVLLADEIELTHRMKHDVVIRISLKELPTPTSADIYRVFQKAILRVIPDAPISPLDSDFSFHYYLQEVVRVIPNAHCVFLVEEAQTLMDMPESFFDALESLRYRLVPKVSIILSGQPQVRSRSNAGLTRLLNEEYHYMQSVPQRDMDAIMALEEARLTIPLTRWKRSIHSLSGGHYGTIKYIDQLIKKHGVINGRLTTSKIMAWAQKEALFQFFLRIVWESITDEERLILTELLETGTVSGMRQKSEAFETCLKLGLIRQRGSALSFIVPMYRDAILSLFGRSMQSHDAKSESSLSIGDGTVRIFGNVADGMFTYQERRVLGELIKQQGTVVSYDAIGLILWGSNTHRFSLENIAQVIRRIRKKLNGLGLAPKVIRSVSKIGYMLII